MTDYSTWVLKDEKSKILCGPVQDKRMLWAMMIEDETGWISAVSEFNDSDMECYCKPPEVWTYYKQYPDGDLVPCTPGGAPPRFAGNNIPTHRSKDGGDTIERIRDE